MAAKKTLPPPIPAFDLPLYPDAFVSALNRAETPIGLLGKQFRLPRKSLAMVEEQLGKPFDSWSKAELQRAVSLLGHWVTCLEDALAVEKLMRQARASPKRGRPKKPRVIVNATFAQGLLGALRPPKKGGRPKGWPDQTKIKLANLLDEFRAEGNLKSYDAAIDRLLEVMAAQAGKPVRSMIRKPLATVKGSLRNAAERGRRLRSKPPK